MWCGKRRTREQGFAIYAMEMRATMILCDMLKVLRFCRGNVGQAANVAVQLAILYVKTNA